MGEQDTKISQAQNSVLMPLIDLPQFSLPKLLFEEKVNNQIKNIIKNIFSSDGKDEEYQPYDGLNAFKKDQIDKIAPWPDWYQTEGTIEKLLENENETKKMVFINQPYSGTDEIVRKYAEINQFQVLEAPPYLDILNYEGDKKLDLKLQEKTAILDLENWFLRDNSGFSFIREVILKLNEHDGTVIIACHSWTWHFLTTVLELPTKQFQQKILQPLQHEELEKWLLELTKKTINRKLLYRMANTGKLVMDQQVDLVKELKESFEKNNAHFDATFEVDEKFTKQLAGYAMGLPVICWHIWRNSLRVHPEENFQIQNGEGEESHAYTIWVMPWDQVSLPSLPKQLTGSHKMVLHTIQLHNGLPHDILYQLLNLSSRQLRLTLDELTHHGILHKVSDHYQVTPNSYPKIRRILDKSGYLVDKLEVS